MPPPEGTTVVVPGKADTTTDLTCSGNLNLGTSQITDPNAANVRELRALITQEVGSHFPGETERFLRAVHPLLDFSDAAFTQAIQACRNDIRMVISEEVSFRRTPFEYPTLMHRIGAWCARLLGRKQLTTPAAISPLENMYAGISQLARLHDAVRSRGECIPPSMTTPMIVLQTRALHSTIQGILIDKILADASRSRVAGAIPTLLAVARSDTEFRFNYGYALIGNNPASYLKQQTHAGSIELDRQLQTPHYQSLVKMLETGTIMLGDQPATVLDVRQLGDVPLVHDGSTREHSGKNLALHINVLYADGHRGSVILKREPEYPTFDLFATQLCSAMGLQSYNAGKGPPGWLAIEKLDAALLGYEGAFGKFQNKIAATTHLTSLSNQQSSSLLEQIGMIFAIEHAFGVRDCKAKHILLDLTSLRPFRIDWEWMFHFQESEDFQWNAPPFPGSCEIELIKHLTQGPEEQHLISCLESGFSRGLQAISAALKQPESSIYQLLQQYYPERASEYQRAIGARCAASQSISAIRK
jgi:prepilin-type processing-associated H-X9-DG protein